MSIQERKPTPPPPAWWEQSRTPAAIAVLYVLLRRGALPNRTARELMRRLGFGTNTTTRAATMLGIPGYAQDWQIPEGLDPAALLFACDTDTVAHAQLLREREYTFFQRRWIQKQRGSSRGTEKVQEGARSKPAASLSAHKSESQGK